MNARTLQLVIPGIPTSDGAGVKLRRSLGASQGLRLDPFLMLDEFSSENPDDYVAGFPPHPHRGFETVTYMLDGHMRHQDHLGNVGELKSGGVQWMTAGRGIIHSEMPQQERGRMRGFQLWINLPADEKMKPADIVTRLKPLAVPGSPFFGSAGELLGAAYLDQGRRDLAGPLFAEIAKDKNVPESLRSRSRQLAGLMGVDAIQDVDKTLGELRAAGAQGAN